MALHNFSYTFEFVSISAIKIDDHKIVNQATCKIVGVELDDNTKQASSLETVYFCPFEKAKTLPSDTFIDLDSLTEAQVETWVRDKYPDNSSLDALFTYLVYGPDELNPPEEGG